MYLLPNLKFSSLKQKISTDDIEGNTKHDRFLVILSTKQRFNVKNNNL